MFPWQELRGVVVLVQPWFLTGPFPPRSLMASRRYYFELLHKQDDRGSDHVEVGVSECPQRGLRPRLVLAGAGARALPDAR